MEETKREFIHKAQNLMRGGNPPPLISASVERESRPGCRRTLRKTARKGGTSKGRGRKPRATGRKPLKREKVRRGVVPWGG
jgi:hypothetical protein